jgi:hypothetical protein
VQDNTRALTALEAGQRAMAGVLERVGGKLEGKKAEANGSRPQGRA